MSSTISNVYSCLAANAQELSMAVAADDARGTLDAHVDILGPQVR